MPFLILFRYWLEKASIIDLISVHSCLSIRMTGYNAVRMISVRIVRVMNPLGQISQATMCTNPKGLRITK